MSSKQLLFIDHSSGSDVHVRKSAAQIADCRGSRSGRIIFLLIKSHFDAADPSVMKRFCKEKKIFPVDFSTDRDDTGIIQKHS